MLWDEQPVHLAYQPPASNTFSQNKPATGNQLAVLFSQNKSAPATSQTNRLKLLRKRDVPDVCTPTPSLGLDQRTATMHLN
jgi:hypothetical protein